MLGLGFRAAGVRSGVQGLWFGQLRIWDSRIPSRLYLTRFDE